MRGRSLTITGAGVLAALAATAPSAGAAIAGGTPLVTDTRPDLVSAQRRDGEQTTPRRVRFCFDARLRSGEVAGQGFELVDYDRSEAERSTEAVVDPEDDRCAIAVFGDDVDLREYTVATADQGAVRDVAHDKVNLRDAVPFSASTGRIRGGLTTAPDVLSVAVDEAYEELVLRFDRRIEPGSVQPGAFSYYQAGGGVVTADGATLDASSGTIVRVHFPDGGGQTTVDDAQRVALQEAAVTALGAPSSRSVRQSVNVEGRDGRTARPELVGAVVAQAPGNAVDFTFDQPVDLEVDGDLQVFRDETTRFDATAATVLESRDGRTVRAWFTTASAQEFAELAVATAGAGAVDSGAPAQLAGSVGSVPLGGTVASIGLTSAPDAHDFEVDLTDGTASVLFDQEVRDVDLSAFRVVDAGGNATAVQPSTLVDVDGHVVTFLVDRDVLAAAQGISLREGAVQTAGSTGDASVQQSVGRDLVVPSRDGDPLPEAPAQPGGPGDVPVILAGTAPAAGGAAPAPAATPAARPRLRFARYRRGTLVVEVAGTKARTVRLRITLRDRRGKVLKGLTRSVRAGRRTTLRGLTRSAKVRSVHLRVL